MKKKALRPHSFSVVLKGGLHEYRILHRKQHITVKETNG